MRILVAAAFAWAVAAPAWAAAEADRLIDALGLPEMMEIMAEEGHSHGDGLGADLFSGSATAGWSATVSDLYDPEAMMNRFRPAFVQGLADGDIGAMLDFFDSELGRRLIRLEIEARRALLDEDIEAAAADRLETMRAEDDPRLELLEQFIDANEIVEANVAGGMNANYAFYVGLSEGGAFGGRLTEDQILADVWAQEPEIRADTREWIWSYLALAYQPLGDDEIRRYTAFSETEPGQELNRALFAAFDVMFVGLSRDLGQAAAQVLGGRDI